MEEGFLKAESCDLLHGHKSELNITDAGISLQLAAIITRASLCLGGVEQVQRC